MAFSVQRECPTDAHEEVLSILQATRSVAIDDRRQKWLYSANPDGEAVLWTVRNETGVLAGFTVCLPRRLVVNGKSLVAWNGADFSILPKFRTLGVAIKLRRAAKLEIDEGEADLLYSHPNEKMQKIHERVGHFCVGQMRRYAKPLQVGNHLPGGTPSWVRRAADLTVGGLLTSSRPEWFRGKCETERVSQLRFDSRYDNLFSDSTMDRVLVGVRDAVYLDWRYGQFPDQEFQLIEAKEGSKLVGFLIYRIVEDAVQIVDVFANEDHTCMDLILHATREARRLRAKSISMVLLESSRILSSLTQIGFSERPDYSNMFSYAVGDELQSLIQNPANWLIHVGDRDV